jgi:hypothetical protein
MAQAAHDGGFEGLYVDNEPYYESVWNYPARTRRQPVSRRWWHGITSKFV